MIYKRFNREISCHHVTTSLHHCVTVSLCHRITVLVSHLPCPLPPDQSAICLAPYHQTSQSFDLPSTTASLCHCATTSPRHRVTMLVSHLPCLLPPNQSVICLAPATKPVSHLPCPCHQTSQSFDLPSTTVSLHHRITVLVNHLPCPLSPNQSVICLAPCHQTSQSFDLPLYHGITVSPHHHISTSRHHHATASLHHCITMPPCHHITTSLC